MLITAEMQRNAKKDMSGRTAPDEMPMLTCTHATGRKFSFEIQPDVSVLTIKDTVIGIFTA